MNSIENHRIVLCCSKLFVRKLCFISKYYFLHQRFENCLLCFILNLLRSLYWILFFFFLLNVRNVGQSMKLYQRIMNIKRFNIHRYVCRWMFVIAQLFWIIFLTKTGNGYLLGGAQIRNLHIKFLIKAHHHTARIVWHRHNVQFETISGKRQFWPCMATTLRTCKNQY